MLKNGANLVQNFTARYERCENNTNAPQTEGGKAIAALWSQWFEIPEKAVSTEMNFFDVGGDSLVGSQTVGLIRKY